MDEDLIIILVLLAIGVYFVMQQKPVAPVPSIGEKIGSGLFDVADKVNEEASKIGSFFENDVKNAFVDIGNNINNTGGNIINETIQATNGVINFFDRIFGSVSSQAQSTGNQINDFFGGIGSQIQNTGDIIANEAKKDAEEVKSFFENVGNTISSWFHF